MKVIPKIKVRDVIGLTRAEFWALSKEEKERRGYYLSTGRINDYRFYHAIGMGGSYREKSWNRKKHQHDCCKSKVAWRHRNGCKTHKENSANDDYSDLKDVSQLLTP